MATTDSKDEIVEQVIPIDTGVKAAIAVVLLAAIVLPSVPTSQDLPLSGNLDCVALLIQLLD